VKLALARAVQRGMIGTKNPDKPVATFLLLGITGSGKTLTAESLAEVLEIPLIKIDAGEMQADHEISKFTGSPPGYKGHNETPSLITQEMLDQSTSKKYKVNVVAIDEFEKAGDALPRLLLGLMDKGKMSDGSNKQMDFTKTVLILTSNIGQAEMQAVLSSGSTIGFAASDKKEDLSPEERQKRLERVADKAIKKVLTPEFRNRIDKIFVYDQLTEEQSQRVLNMNLAKVQQRSFFQNPQTRLVYTVTPAARDFILNNGYESEFGGRSVRRTIEHLIVEPVTNLIASEKVSSGDLIEVDVTSDKAQLKFKKIAEGLSDEQQAQIYKKMYGTEAPELKIKTAPPVSEKYFNFLNELDQTADSHLKLDKIANFLNSPEFGDREFLDIYYRLPGEMDWGYKEGKDITDEMKKLGIGTWDKMTFEPVRLRFLWYGMKRLKTLSPENKTKMSKLISPMIMSTLEWLNTQAYYDKPIKEGIIQLLVYYHTQVMNLPPN
jgi:ATP-dependent Clp protease ATP-binding subunit ClpB